MSDLYIPTIGLPILLEEICRPILGLYKIAHRLMNVEIGAEAALLPEKDYISWIFVAVYGTRIWCSYKLLFLDNLQKDVF